MKTVVLGINFKTAPVELRERFSFTDTSLPTILMRAGESLPHDNIAILSTCNRTEMYVMGESDQTKADLLSLLAIAAEEALPSDPEEHFYFKTGQDAVEHLMAVTASLDSMVVGETEVLGQVKQAYQTAASSGESCRYLHQLFPAAIRAAKRVHTETDICRGNVSVSSVAVSFARRVFEDLTTKTVMIIGAGETAERSLCNLIEKGVRNVLVLNRSLKNARLLADRYKGRAVPLNELDSFLPQADIVISCTSAPHLVLHSASVRTALEKRHGRPMFLIDIAVPRDIEAAVGDLANVYLYGIDDLQSVATENMARRRESLEHAWHIVNQEAAAFAAEDQGPSLEDMMKRITERSSQIETTELANAFAGIRLSNLSKECKDDINKLVANVSRRLLGPPRRTLREARKNGRWELYAEVATDLLGITEEEKADDES